MSHYLDHMRMGRPTRGRILVAGGAAIIDDIEIPRGRVARILADAADCKIRISPDYLRDCGFEEQGVAGSQIQPPWGIENIVDSVQFSIATAPAALFGLKNILCAGNLNQLANGSLDVCPGGNLGDWAGAGTGAPAQTAPGAHTHAAGGLTVVNGGGQAWVETQQVDAIALEEYTISAWLEGNGAQFAHVRIIDDNSGEYLTAAGAWQVGAAYCLSEDGAALARHAISFFAPAGATTFTVTLQAPDQNSTVYFDEIALTISSSYLLQQTIFEIPATTDMTVAIQHYADDLDAGFRFAIVKLAVAPLFLQVGGGWAAGEYWRPVVGVVGTTQNHQIFTSDVTYDKYALIIKSNGIDDRYNMWFDRIFISEVCLATDAELAYPGPPEYVYVQRQSRASVIDGAGNVSIAEMAP